MTTDFYTTRDNVKTTTTGYTAGSGSIALAIGTGQMFGSTFPLVFSTFDAAGAAKGVYLCTGRAGDTLVGLALLSGVDVDLPAGSLVSICWTAAHADQLATAVNALEQVLYTLAPLDSPPLTGVPTAPTAAPGTNTTQLATCGFVLANAGATDPNTPYVLRFPGPPAQSHVDCGGGFWDLADGTDVGTCFWDAIFKPTGTGNGYLVSDGYGGAHMLLWGLGGTPGGITGNINTSAGASSFAGNYLVAQGEWCHHAVGIGDFVGRQVWTYVNGIPDGVCNLAGTRQTGGPIGNLYIGGSDHINLAMDCAYIRGFDFNTNPWAGAPNLSFFPPRFTTIADRPHFLLPMNTPGVLADLAPTGTIQTDGTYATHSGAARGLGAGGAIYDLGFPALSHQGSGVPFWVADPNSPYCRPLGVGTFNTGETILAPLTPPGGCKVYDSFGRRNQTYWTDITPSIGQTEAGSLGPLTWSQDGLYINPAADMPVSVGILQSQLVNLSCQRQGVAWVEIGDADFDLRIQGPMPGPCQPGCAGGVFRLVDKDNWLGMFTGPASWNDYSAGGQLSFLTCAAAAITTTATLTIGAGLNGWIRCVGSGTTLTFYGSAWGDGANWTPWGSAQTGVTTYLSATKVGVTFGTHQINPIGFTRVRQFVCF